MNKAADECISERIMSEYLLEYKAEAIVSIVFAVVYKSEGESGFFDCIVLPVRGIGAFLRQLSLSGATGNVLAIILYSIICGWPLILLAVLFLISMVVAYIVIKIVRLLDGVKQSNTLKILRGCCVFTLAIVVWNMVPEMKESFVNDKVIASLRKLTIVCKISIVTIVLSQVAVNLIQLIAGAHNNISNINVSFPITSIVLIAGLMLISKLIEESAVIKEEDEMFI